MNRPAASMPRGAFHDANHPLAALRTMTARIAFFAGAAILLCGTWAFWPLGSTQVDLPAEPSPPMPLASVTKPHPLDLSAFSAPTWEAPPLPPKPAVVATAPPAPPPPPLKLQLLGIVHDGTCATDGTPLYVAAIYDETADKLLMLRAGDSIGAAHTGNHGRISRVHADAVELTDASGPRRLALRQPLVPIPGLLRSPAPARTTGSGGQP